MIGFETAEKVKKSISDSLNRITALDGVDADNLLVHITGEYIEMLKTLCFILENEAPTTYLRLDAGTCAINMEVAAMELEDIMVEVLLRKEQDGKQVRGQTGIREVNPERGDTA